MGTPALLRQIREETVLGEAASIWRCRRRNAQLRNKGAGPEGGPQPECRGEHGFAGADRPLGGRSSVDGSFNEGNRYAEFNPGMDQAAAYGIAGLIAGGLLTKAGFFKGLL